MAEPFYFHLLLRNHQVQEAIALLREHHAWLEQHDYLPELRQEFAAQALAGHTEIISGLAPDDPVAKDYPLASAALDAYARGDDLGLAQQLKQISYRSPYRDLGQIRALLRSTLDCLPLQRAADLDLTWAEMELACEVLRRLQHDELRARFAERALARWPDTPVFVYHRIDAGCSGWYMGLQQQKIQELEAALERARAEGDERTAHRIGRLLDTSPFIAPKGRPHAADLEDQLGGLVDMLGVERTLDLLLSSGDPAAAKILKAALGPQGLRRLLEAHARGEVIALAQVLSGVSGGLDETAPVPMGRRSEDRRGAKRRSDRNQLDLF